MLIYITQTKPSTPDPDLIPTQVLVTGSSQIQDEMFQYATHRVQLSQSKTQEIKEHSVSKGHEYRYDIACEGIVRCQCGWNSEEPEMVGALAKTKRCMLTPERSNAPSAVLDSIFCATVSTAQVTQGCPIFMPAIAASLGQTKHACCKS